MIDRITWVRQKILLSWQLAIFYVFGLLDVHDVESINFRFFFLFTQLTLRSSLSTPMMEQHTTCTFFFNVNISRSSWCIIFGCVLMSQRKPNLIVFIIWINPVMGLRILNSHQTFQERYYKSDVKLRVQKIHGVIVKVLSREKSIFQIWCVLHKQQQ